jgi:uncharacterized protein DUF3489
VVQRHAAIEPKEIPMIMRAKKRTAARSAASSSSQPKLRKAGHKGNRVLPARSGTKQSAAIDMLRAPGGATIAALTKATGWQSHSVRGFLAGVVRKRLKLDLKSAVVEGIRIYQILDEYGTTSVETKSNSRKS